MESAHLVELAGVFNQISSSFGISNSIGLFCSLGQSSAHRMRSINHRPSSDTYTSSFEGPVLRATGERERLGMSAMEGLKVWLNQKIANILGDLQEKEPVEDPSPTRAGCRIFFMVSLLLGFLLLLVYNFNDAPDARVFQIYHLKPGDENHAFPSCFLYDRNSTNCKKWSKSKFPEGIPVSCPCTNTSFPWKDFVKFYVLHENSTDWKMESTNESYNYHPKVTMPLGNNNIVKDTEFLTAEKFCNLSYQWPFSVPSDTSSAIVWPTEKKVTENLIWFQNCVWIASLLFPGSNSSYEDRTRSTQFLNPPSLLSREEFNTLLAQLARESVLTRRLALEMAYVGNENFRRFYNSLALLLTGLLDRDEMDLNQSYVYGAKDLSLTLSSNQVYDKNARVWYLEDDSGPIFLQPEIDWEKYRQTCNPVYCEVIKPMRGARKLYWALGILGGVATIVLAVVTTLLWPCTAMLLLWIFKRNAAATGDPERPSGPLLRDVELSSPRESGL